MNPKDVAEWRENIIKLPDHHFFDLIQPVSYTHLTLPTKLEV